MWLVLGLPSVGKPPIRAEIKFADDEPTDNKDG
jgi:hypothetical protein